MATERRRHTDDGRRPGPLQVVFSVAAAFFGVQSSRVRRRDFTHGRPGPFLAVALLMTAVVVLAFVAAARLALRYLGPV